MRSRMSLTLGRPAAGAWNGLVLLARALCAAAVLCALTVARAPASGLAEPRGEVILTITGKITHTNSRGAARLDLAMLESLGSERIRTRTPWTDGLALFEGVLMRKVLAAVGATGRSVLALAINDYQAEIPATDFDRHRVILAYRKNGRRLTIRDRGPLWIIYPWTDKKALRNELYYVRSVWQLKELVVR